MATTLPGRQQAAEAYDYQKVREYYKKRGGWIISWHSLVRADTLDEKIVLDIAGAKMPDEVRFNGERYRLERIRDA